MNKYIPTKKIELPTTKIVIEVLEYLNTGALRKVQKIIFDGGMIGTQSEQKVDGKQAALWYEMQEEALRFAFISGTKINDDGSQEKLEISDPVAFIGELPPADGNKLYQEISDIINKSMMTNDGKKN